MIRVSRRRSDLGFGSAIALGGEPAKSTSIVVFGDSQAPGLADGLSRVPVEDARYRVLNRTLAGAALVHGPCEWLAPIERFTFREKADVAVVMFGANDRLDLHGDDGSYLHFRTDEWRAAYAARADAILAPPTAGSRDGTTERLRGDDGIHFTAAGYELVAERIIGLLHTRHLTSLREHSASDHFDSAETTRDAAVGVTPR